MLRHRPNRQSGSILIATVMAVALCSMITLGITQILNNEYHQFEQSRILLARQLITTRLSYEIHNRTLYYISLGLMNDGTNLLPPVGDTPSSCVQTTPILGDNSWDALSGIWAGGAGGGPPPSFVKTVTGAKSGAVCDSTQVTSNWDTTHTGGLANLYLAACVFDDTKTAIADCKALNASGNPIVYPLELVDIGGQATAAQNDLLTGFGQTIYTPVATPVYYNLDGTVCTSGAAKCPFAATTTFTALCDGGAASCAQADDITVSLTITPNHAVLPSDVPINPYSSTVVVPVIPFGNNYVNGLSDISFLVPISQAYNNTTAYHDSGAYDVDFQSLAAASSAGATPYSGGGGSPPPTITNVCPGARFTFGHGCSGGSF